jgi:chlorite dismutase
MPEETPRTLNHYSLFTFTPSYWALESAERKKVNAEFLANLRSTSPVVELYQIYPAAHSADFLVWSAMPAGEKAAAAAFFERFARATSGMRAYIQPVAVLWGFTRPSLYTRTRSTQEIDPFDGVRQPYLVIYPFVKTIDWYLMSREARQGMMNEHIRIGKQYEDITQLLLYSFGLQDQEFVVVYETDDLPRFSDLVNELRSTEARRYTQRDAPLYTAIHHPVEETLALWE